jgi:hypothetical protein
MSKDEIIAILRDYMQSHKEQYGIKSLGIFGSISRDDFDDDSDVDVFVELDKPDMFLLAGIKQDIEESLHRPVDIVRLREKMNPFLKRHIVQDGRYV